MDRWRTEEPSPEKAAELITGIRPLLPAEAACLPDDWLYIALVGSCAGSVMLDDDERLLLADLAWERLPQPRALAEGPIGSWLGADQLECMVSLILPSSATLEERAMLIGRLLVGAFADRGSLWEADPEVVAALHRLMGQWPLHDDSWWKSLWEGIAGDRMSGASVTVRLAIVEALLGRLSEDQWLDRLDGLAALDEVMDGLATATLHALGMCLSRSLPPERTWGLLVDAPPSDALLRSIVIAFPLDLRWPLPGHSAVPVEVLEALRDLRDSSAFPYAQDLLPVQWGLLGPAEAVRDLERFTLGADSSSPSWAYGAAARIHGTMTANVLSGGSRGRSQELDLARHLTGEWLASMPPDDLRRLASELTKFWQPGDRHAEPLRAQLIEWVGSSAFEGWPEDVRRMLSGD